MADRPIIFSGPMIRALLDGRKTQARRVLHPQPKTFSVDDQGTPCDVGLLHVEGDLLPRIATGRVITLQEVRFAIGDRLWVRESVARMPDLWGYKADGDLVVWPGRQELAGKTRDSLPSIFMPRSASRLTLTVTNVRVERLQEISETDAWAEGVPDALEGDVGDEVFCRHCKGMGTHGALGTGLGVIEVDCAECATAALRFRNLWNGLHGPEAWAANPWVVALTFTVEQRNIDAAHPLQTSRGSQ